VGKTGTHREADLIGEHVEKEDHLAVADEEVKRRAHREPPVARTRACTTLIGEDNHGPRFPAVERVPAFLTTPLPLLAIPSATPPIVTPEDM
jgi:hypothetical protein